MLFENVVDAGLCTHCGTCVGLCGGSLELRETGKGLLPFSRAEFSKANDEAAYAACPGKGLYYPSLNDFVFNQQPSNWLLGCFRKAFIGYSLLPDIRRNAASGGIITQTLLYLLEHKLIEGAVVVRTGVHKPWEAEPVIATTPEEIRAASQSVYVPVPVNRLLGQMESFKGRLAYVGLPDQVASLRHLQQAGHKGALKVEYVIGPYVGTMMYFNAIQSYLRSNGVRDINDVVELRYRAGEWPGYLLIKLRSGRELRAEKFYYNYLIPFYITQSSLLSVDFTNELTDISVGDAWQPKYESQRQGFSVVVARSEKGERLLSAMQSEGVAQLDEVTVDEALSMHGHMLDFKKRGAFIRIRWRALLHKRIPDFGYRPTRIPVIRTVVEIIIVALFGICRTAGARWIVERMPLSLIGPLFNTLRKSWKNLSKPAKRKGLARYSVEFLPQ